MSSVSQKKLSEMLGVTQAAISKALSGAPDISPELRARIKAKASELGYRPNKLARSLVGGRTDIIGIFMPPPSETLSKFYGSILYGLNRAFRNCGYASLILCSSGDDQEDERHLNALQQYKIAGLIIVSTALTPRLSTYFAKMIEEGTAVASIGETGIQGMPFAVGKDAESVREMVGLMVARGHRRIVFASAAKINSGRAAAFLATAKELGLPEQDKPVAHCVDDMATESELSELMGSSTPPSAIFAAHDGLALRIISTLERLGYAVPADVSVVGFGDDVNFPEHMRVPLTTVKHDIQALGEGALGLLLKQLRGEPCPDSYLADNFLVERGSLRRL